MTAEQWADLADALGEVRKSDGAPRVLDAERVIECVRELRAELADAREHIGLEVQRYVEQGAKLRAALAEADRLRAAIADFGYSPDGAAYERLMGAIKEAGHG